MKKLFFVITLIITMLSGCASVPMADTARSNELKQFNSPPQDKSGIYIYRTNSLAGAVLKKNLYIDDIFIGESAKGTFFYRQVIPGRHKIATESEFGNNELSVNTVGGQNYFIRQYMKIGAFVGGANLEEVSESQARRDMVDVHLAQ